MTTASCSQRIPFGKNNILKISAFVFLAFWLSTLITTPDLNNWMLENTLVFLFIGLLISTYRKFKLSDASYMMIAFYLCMHVYGAKYTYAENPLGYWISDMLHLQRNNYDRIVHFSFGLLLAYPMRDFFRNWFGWPAWVCWVLPAEITLSFSGMYELIEWAVADLLFPDQGAAYLGSQGDIWDAQKDMGLAFSGAILSMSGIAILKSIFGKDAISETDPGIAPGIA